MANLAADLSIFEIAGLRHFLPRTYILAIFSLFFCAFFGGFFEVFLGLLQLFGVARVVKNL
jgi:hypothetical protein